jgi:hypothetical protein
LKGKTPVRITYSSTPNAHISASDPLYYLLTTISGAI